MRGKRSWPVVMILMVCGMLQAAETETQELTGRVICPNGNPVAGAEVRFYAFDGDEAQMRLDLKELGKTQTDGLGQFTFPVEAESAHETFCLVESESLSYGWGNFFSAGQPTDVHLTAATVMSGVVRNAAGEPAAGAEVRLFILTIPGEMPTYLLGLDPVNVFAAVTDEKGYFEFTGLPETASGELLVKKAGMGSLNTLRDTNGIMSGLTYKAGQTDIELTLPAGCTVTGKVEDTAGQTPVAGVGVQIVNTEVPLPFLNPSAVSEADGTVRFTDLAPGSYRLIARSDEWVSAPVEIEVQGDTEATIGLSKGGLLEVKVVDGETGEAVAGATAIVRPEDERSYERVEIGEDGTGRKQLLAGRYRVAASMRGYQSAQEQPSVEIEDGKTASVTVRLAGQPTLSGRVLDPAGKPVEGAEVQMFLAHGQTARSDAEGRFKLKWNPDQMPSMEGDYQLIALHKERNLAGVEPIGRDSKTVTVKLREGASVQGRVIDPDGKPLANARAMIYFQSEGYGSSFGMDQRTDAEGRYTFACLPLEQQFSMNISDVPGYGSGRSEFQTDTRGPLTLEDIVLQVADLKVTGQVVDVDGKGLANADVQASGSGQPSVRVKTDAEGRFVLENVCAGRLYINASYNEGNNYMHGYVQTEGGAEEIRLVMGGQNSGRFVPRKAASLVGKPLGELAAYGLQLPAEVKAVALFVWDMNQRPSRHFVKAFAEKTALLQEKGVTAVLLQAGEANRAALDEWLEANGIACPCGMIGGDDADEARFKLGVQGLPWLILTDAAGTVVAEGFTVDELEGKLNSL